MKRSDFYGELTNRFRMLVRENGLWEEEVTVTGKILNDEEAIGTPDRRDFPLLTGKESLMEARFRDSLGQAFTDQPGPFTGSLGTIIEEAGLSNHHRAVFISALNAVTAHLKGTAGTVHCRDNQMESCACDLAIHLKGKKIRPRVALVGYQPSMLQKLSSLYPVRVLDLDGDKIGTSRYGITVESGREKRDEALDWCDIILCTGSTVTNGTLPDYLGDKPILFYGTTLSGTAELMGLPRFCPRSTTERDFS